LSIFDRIKNAIFGEAHAAPAPQRPGTASASPSSSAPPTTQPVAPSAPAAAPAPTSTASSAAQSTTAMPRSSQSDEVASSSLASQAPVDVQSILNEAVKKSGQKLDWRHSIVDLMKALGMDASLQERKELAQELGYPGDANDSAKMNIFLHKALMKKLSESGGHVPSDLLN
jgi:hypothetical protein